MYYYLVAPQLIGRGDEDAFTYHSDQKLAVGTLVRVSFGRRAVNGIVLRVLPTKPTFKTKPIDSLVAPAPLPEPLVKLARWLGEYYATHLATVLQTILPAGLHRSRRKVDFAHSHPSRLRTNNVLNEAQQAALKTLQTSPTGTVLLHGVTGSGKTQVYIEAARQQAEAGRSAVILVPEISLTPQLVAEFANHFNNLIVTHSGMTEAARHQAWLQALLADEPTIVVGPRSALFLPLKNVGLIVVDECHEPSYKQEQAPRYSALRAASMLARYHKAKLILGSATPSIIDYYIAEATKTPIAQMTKPAVAITPAVVDVADLKKRDQFRKHRFFSDILLQRVQDALDAKQQVLLFHNRRGTSPTALCEHCGWVAQCPTCYLPLTLHADQHILRCHICGFSQAVPPSCPVCHEPDIIFKGIGTKLIEDEIRKLFPKANIARFDADTHATQAVHQRYQELYDGTIQILIGTQMLAKGLDLPHLSVVGVIQADSGLVLPDYQAEERVFQLLYQVMGRVGRGKHAGHVVIQTYQPDHPIIQAALKRDYKSFYEAELSTRKAGHFPPYYYLLKLTCSYKTESGAITASRKLLKELQAASASLEILGPTPAFYERMGGNYRWQLVLKAKNRAILTAIAAKAPQGWQADIDPISLL